MRTKRNAIQKSQYINQRYKDYLRSSFSFDDDNLQKMFVEKLMEEELFKGPYVDLNLPFQRGKSVNQLIEDGTLCDSFKKINLEESEFERPLYSHQEEALKLLSKGRSAVITTGTGSGKTECFLFPIFNDILKDIENGIEDVGIRAIFLYPMNALVNDQIERVRYLLKNCPDITYGFFTGETKEKSTDANRKEYEEQNAGNIPINEMISREDMRNKPPHILFTNYSMLEYLLIRPNDYAIFTPQRLNNWKYIVMDEAHSYSGSLGIELSMLMRRLTGLADKKPRFILTSATLGQQGKSEKDIVEFAKNLTSADFEKGDIIFSKRINLSNAQGMYRVKPEDYLILIEKIGAIEEFRNISEVYNHSEQIDVKGLAYELLIKDKNVHEIYDLLKNGCKEFEVIRKQVSSKFSIEELSALIDLINVAKKNGIGIFDLKYHSFVRPLSGAYVTLGSKPKLTLTKTNTIGDMKAFELGNCRYCNSAFIIGKRIFSSKLMYLFQNSEVDIYENYGENSRVNVDYFLLNNDVDEEENEQKNLVEEILCAKCGAIYDSANLNAKECSCGAKYKTKVYRVVPKLDKEEVVVYNNIYQCPCCGHKSSVGIVRSLNVGKDEGTAVVAQMLYNSIDVEEKETLKKKNGLSLTIGNKKMKIEEKKDEKENVKQFLAFSDSRQQASFSAVFFDATHIRMLKKRLIWQVIEQQKYRDISVDQLVSFIEHNIRQYGLFNDKTLLPNEAGMSSSQNAWATVLADLLKVDGNYDGEGLGLYYFDIDLSDIMKEFDDSDVEESFGQFGIRNKEELGTLMQVVLGIFQTAPAIYYPVAGLSQEEKKECLGYQMYDLYIMYKSPKQLSGIRSFLPVRNKSNMVMRYVMKACKCDEKDAEEILDVVFNQLAVPVGNLQGNNPFLVKHGNKEAYQMSVGRYILKNYKTSKYYQCKKCGRLTPYNLHGVCIQDKCNGTLFEVNPDIILENNYYRNEYKTKKIESIIIKEHTAQIGKGKGKLYQNAFKDGKINILSCSTTFEMGIDIGSLETVFMRNVPPTPANYVQRAGRAGRGKNSSAYILTYCSASSHDYTYFQMPEKMISGIIHPPFFDVVNKKIIVRHLMAASLGFFFRQRPEYFNSLNVLIFEGIDVFNDFMMHHPKGLSDYIQKILPEDYYEEYKGFKWFEEMGGRDEKLQKFADDIKELFEEYENAKKYALADDRLNDATYYKNQIDYMKKRRVIDLLSTYCVIPKYGFPIDLVKLNVYDHGVCTTSAQLSVELSRDLKIAITEYAPDCEVVADGKKYTSRYVSLPKNCDLPKVFFCTCPDCKKNNVGISDRSIARCKHCGKDISNIAYDYFLEPNEGFKTGLTTTSAGKKPKKSYAGEISYIGGGEEDENVLDIGNILRVETSRDDELMIVNKSSFYMCPVCGYSEIYNGGIKTPNRMKEHENYRTYKCSSSNMNRIRIGHRFRTDVARFILPSLVAGGAESYSVALSFLYAFVEGISEALNIDRNDLDGLIEMNLDTYSYDVLIYDNVSGGAGHVKRLINREAVICSLYKAKDKVSQHCCAEETSCYNCLRNYYNQIYHSRLKRGLAKKYIEELIGKLENV